jgi:hypothetical protein
MHIGTYFKHLFHPQRSNNHRPRLLHPESFLVLALAGVGFWFALGPAKFLAQQTGNVLGFASNITASQVIQKTNDERSKLGLSTLAANDKLNQAALAKAQNMFSQQYWAHIAPDGTEPWKFFRDAQYHYSVAGENLARDFSNTDGMMAAWMASPTHRANIVNPKYKEIGIAVVDGKLLGTDTTLVVQLFGAPLGGAPQVNAPAQAPKKLALANAPATIPAVQPAVAPSPSVEGEHITLAEDQPTVVQQSDAQGRPTGPAQILASVTLPVSSFGKPILLSPLQMLKAFFLAVIFLIVITLIYDSLIMGNRKTVRLVGNNFAHIVLFCVVAFLLIFFKGGVVG